MLTHYFRKQLRLYASMIEEWVFTFTYILSDIVDLVIYLTCSISTPPPPKQVNP